MNGTLIDTNVILRYLIDDDEEQSLIAEHIIDGAAWTTPEVLAETSWVLSSVYHLSRERVAGALIEISHRVFLEPQDVTMKAILEYDSTNLDFVDCMIVAYDKLNISNVFTFDKALNRRLTSN